MNPKKTKDVEKLIKWWFDLLAEYYEDDEEQFMDPLQKKKKTLVEILGTDGFQIVDRP
jgi:hypothetical protein